MADDWAQLDYYKKLNSEIDLPSKNENRIVFMGNSITEGWGQLYPEYFSKKSFINRGISGQTTPQMLIRFRPDVIDLKPVIVIILAGINDIAGNTGPSTVKMICDNIISMAELAKINGIKVILSSVLPAGGYPWEPGIDPSKTIIAVNKIINDYSKNNNMLYLDYYSSLVYDNDSLNPDYTYDGVHPNKSGYKIMSKLADSVIAKALVFTG
ncbi:uncharacterized protein METZ01_LOCUS105351 [marine metagenome]|uniref:SGNH hydrolase-type esterase domain-containing protein n=1 Tax=marine metagenome TaxID=408172 RepID=A0A381WKL0_9ZZZZ